MMSMAHGREVWSRCHSRRKHRLGDVRRAHAQYDRIDVETADDRRAAATRICDAPSAASRRSSRPRTFPGLRPMRRMGPMSRRDIDMWRTCSYAGHMPTMIQLRHVPDDLHRKLKARAALAGMSLSDYLLREIREMAERPTVAELRARLDRRASVRLSLSPAKAVRAERDAR